MALQRGYVYFGNGDKLVRSGDCKRSINQDKRVNRLLDRCHE